MLVDDDERFRAIARRTLVTEGAKVVAEVGRGSEVPDAVARWRPDVVLLDIGLPDIDGAEVARRLGEGEDGPAVVLISTRDDVYGHQVSAGVAEGYLAKDSLSLAAIVDIVGPSPSDA